MHRLSATLIYCIVLVFSDPKTAVSQILSLSGGIAECNNTTVPTATMSLLYQPWSNENGFLVGIRAGQLYGVPTIITASNSSGSEFVRNDGTSTVTYLMGSIGYALRFSSDTSSLLNNFSASVVGSFGGVNAANRRYTQWSGAFGGGSQLSPDDPNTFTWTSFASSIAFGGSVSIEYQFSRQFSTFASAGWDHFSADIITSPNVEPYRTYTATLAGPQTYVTLGLRYTLHADPHADPHEDRLQLLAILASSHPFTSTPYNEFNPGLAIHWRPKSTGITPFAEGGAYQYSVGDRAMYLGGGVLFPLGTEWIKAGIFGGGLATFDAQGAYFYPALSPRLVIDTPWASATALLIPAGDATAIGFMLGFPLF